MLRPPCYDRRSTSSGGSFVAVDDVGASLGCPQQHQHQRQHQQHLDSLLRWESDDASYSQQTEAAVWPTAPNLARLLTTACRSMRDSLHGEDFGDSAGSVHAAVSAAEAAARTASAAVADAVKLLKEHHGSEGRPASRTVSKLELLSPPTSPSFKSAAGQSQPRKDRPIDDGRGHRCAWNDANGGGLFYNSSARWYSSPNRYAVGRKLRSLPSSPALVFRPLELSPPAAPFPGRSVLSRISISSIDSRNKVHNEERHESAERGNTDWRECHQDDDDKEEQEVEKGGRPEVGE